MLLLLLILIVPLRILSTLDLYVYGWPAFKIGSKKIPGAKIHGFWNRKSKWIIGIVYVNIALYDKCSNNKWLTYHILRYKKTYGCI